MYKIPSGQRQFVDDYFDATVGFLNPKQVAVYPLPFERATAFNFLSALSATNTIVGYFDHELEAQGQNNARALCFWRVCLAPSALTTWVPQGPGDPGVLYPPAGAELSVGPSGFTPKAKVVFLAACGIDRAFIDQWHLAESGHALIVPQYDSPAMHINLKTAANEFEAFLGKLGTGGTVDEAVGLANQQAARNGSLYSWRVIGDGNVNFNPQTK